MWNRQSPVLYQCLEIEEFAWRFKNLAGNIESLLGIWQVRFDIHC